jgi:hypothetical protein
MGRTKGFKHSEETKHKMSVTAKRIGTGKFSLLGKHHSIETRKKLSMAKSGKNHPFYGKHLTDEHKEKIRRNCFCPWKGMMGDKSPGWRGGKTSEAMIIRSSSEYELWRMAIFERDNFTCQKYGIRGGRLVAHHINNFAERKDLRLAIDNGITLSRQAHEEFHKIYGKSHNTKEQLNEFLKHLIK